MNTLTHKEKKFADDILEGKTKRQAAKDNYNIGSKGGKIENIDVIADAISQETSNKPQVIAYLEDNAYDASTRIVELAKTATNETTKLNANKDILDRAGYKPIERAVNLTVNVKSIDPTNPEVLDLIDKLRKANENQ